LIAGSSKSTGLTQADTKIVVEEILKSIRGFLEMDKQLNSVVSEHFTPKSASRDRPEIQKPGKWHSPVLTS
jgi:hypothetical protein